jgi:PAS domain S-box-containing protein
MPVLALGTMPVRGWFESTFERGPVGAALLSEKGTIVRANPAFRSLAGPRTEVEGHSLSELFVRGGAELEAALDRAVRERTPETVVGCVLEPPPRDRRHTVDAELYPQSEEGGRSTGTLVVLRDRTALGLSRSDSTLLFYQAFLHSTNPMELTDRDGFLVDVNPAFERIYGYPREELLGRKPSLVASGKTDRSVYERMWHDLVDPKVGAWSGEVTNCDRSGKEHPVLLSITAVRDGAGAITHFLGVSVDLTERRAWERQAMHAERLASLGQLAAGVAHEINTPLANITLIAESIRRRTGDAWTRDRVASLLEQTDSAARIVRGLLDFGRRPEVRIGEFDLGETVRAAAGFLRGKQAAGVELEVAAPDSPTLFRGDREQIRQVVVNLLNNAYDALGDRGRIEVALGVADGWAEVRVSDTGPGISPEVRPHLFEPFFTTKPEGKGTGLGLAICHGIVESHGGTIEVESEPGKGATFVVKLPLPPVRRGPP